MLVAVAHVLGAIIATFAFGFLVLVVGTLEADRNRKAVLQETSISLGIPSAELEHAANSAKLMRFAAERFSSELLRNRLSDLCGIVSKCWEVIGITVQIGFLWWVVWSSFSDASFAANAWWIVAIAVFFFITSAAFALVCKLLTGRFPGQAAQARKILAQSVESQRAMPQSEDDP